MSEESLASVADDIDLAEVEAADLAAREVERPAAALYAAVTRAAVYGDGERPPYTYECTHCHAVLDSHRLHVAAVSRFVAYQRQDGDRHLAGLDAVFVACTAHAGTVVATAQSRARDLQAGAAPGVAYAVTRVAWDAL